MIQANELRIGNYVYDFANNPVEVTRITKDKMAIERPIPLTPEILKQCGFARKEKFKFYKNFLAIDHIENEWIVVQFDKVDGQGHLLQDLTIKYLHQLQNLYFALTQTELTITL